MGTIEESEKIKAISTETVKKDISDTQNEIVVWEGEAARRRTALDAALSQIQGRKVFVEKLEVILENRTVDNEKT